MADAFVPSCAICLSDLDDDGKQHALDCGHVFHSSCVIEAFRAMSNTQCPMCRRPGSRDSAAWKEISGRDGDRGRVR